MSKMSKAIVALGVVAGLGVAALPLSSYAATSQKVNVEAIVDSSISLSATDDAGNTKTNVSLNPENGGDIAKDTVKLSVTANGGGYRIVANATNLTVSEAANIPYGTPAKGTSAWGLSKDGGTNWLTTGAPNTIEIANVANVNAEGASKDVTVSFGVSTSANQEPGTYSGSVTFTVTAQ